MTPTPASLRGIGLIEILIAVILISIGFLAAARMQVQGMRFSQSAYFQSQAYFLAGDMIDRMRANPLGVDQGAYDAVDTTDAVADPNCGSTVICTAAQQAQQDIFDWRQHFQPTVDVNPLLPGGDGSAANGQIFDRGDNRFEVTITWFEIIDGESTAQVQSMFFVAETV